MGIAKLAGGVNKNFHFRKVTPLDRQTIIRMNKDTLYSMAVIDTEGGATITVPEIQDGRYMSVYLLDNDNYVPFVIYQAGTHQLPRDTKHIAMGIRIQLFNPDDAEELALVNYFKDQFVIKAESSDELPAFNWDMESLDVLRTQYENDSVQYGSWAGMSGQRGKVNDKTRRNAAAARGLFPEIDASYFNYSGGHDENICHTATYEVPENNAFWSITIYGADGYMKHDNNIINSSNVLMNEDETFTVYFGSKDTCGDVDNRVEVAEGWNFLMRVYLPGDSVLDGSYKLPKVVPVTK